MNPRIYIVILLVLCLSCSSHREKLSDEDKDMPGSEISFDKEKWSVKEGKDYPFREAMLNDLVYNDTVRSLNTYEILDLLGEPDRTNENHLYYMIDQKRLGSWAIHTKTMVIKFTDDNTVEWIKIHE